MKKIIDQNGRLFGLISVIDVAVIAIVAVLAAAFLTKNSATPIITIAAPMEPITYTLSVTNMPDGRLESLRVGDTLYDKETFNPVGTITDLQYEDCVTTILKADGTYVVAPVENRYNVTITVQAQAMTDERQHLYINRSNLVASGWYMDLYTKTCFFGAIVTEIR